MLNNTKLGLVILMSLAMVLRVIPVEASPGRQITCESDDDRYKFCRTDTRGGVRFVRQLSQTSCRKNSSWGYDRDGIWVDRGCRGVFEVEGRSSEYHNNSRNSDGATAAAIVGGAIVVGAIAAALSHNDGNRDSSRIIRCESRDENCQYCRTRIDNRVILRRQLSEFGCWQGSTWGYDRDGVWVDRGCRAEFQIR